MGLILVKQGEISSGIYISRQLDSDEKRIVVVAPLTRVNQESEVKWKTILKFANKKTLRSLIIIDKTPNHQASEFLMKYGRESASEVLILQRPSSEPLFDSLRFIKLDSNLWITQVHDDDSWSDDLDTVVCKDQNVIYSPLIYVKSNKVVEKVTPANNSKYPQSVLFSFLPSLLWNKFVDFMNDQGGHVAISQDATLQQIARLFKSYSFTDGYSYTYNIDNWVKKRKSMALVKKYSILDGWGSYSGIEIALINRALDKFSATIYFKDMFPGAQVEADLNQLFHEFQLSKKRKLVTFFAIKLQTFLLLIACVIEKTSIMKGHGLKLRIRKSQRRDILILFMASGRIQDLFDLLHFVSNLDKMKVNFELKKRVNFWHQTIAQHHES